MDIQAFSSIYSSGNGASLCAGIIFSLLVAAFCILAKLQGGGSGFGGVLEVFMMSAITSLFGGLFYAGLVDFPAQNHAYDAYMEEFKDTLAVEGFTLVNGELPFENHDKRTIKIEKDGEFSICEVTVLKDSEMLSFECATLSTPVNLETLVTK